MTNVGDDFSVGGQLSTIFLAGFVGSEGIRWQTRLGTIFFVLDMGGIWSDNVFSTVHGVSGVTVMGVL